MDVHDYNPAAFNWRYQIKALIGSAVAGLSRLEAVIEGGVTSGEWVGVAITVLVTYGGVFGFSNRER